MPVADVVGAITSKEGACVQIGSASVVLGDGAWQGHSPAHHWPTYLGLSPCYLLENELRWPAGPGHEQLRSSLGEMVQAAPMADARGACFVDARSALRHWFGLQRSPDVDDAIRPKVEVLVPPAPGQVRRVRTDAEGNLLIELWPGLDNVSVRLAVEDEDGQRTVDGIPRGEGYMCEGPLVGVVTIYVFALSELVAHYRTHSGSIQGAMAKSTNVEILEHIRQGESEIREFKQAEPGDPRRWRWDGALRTIAAFANTRGGTVFVGVDKELEVQGLAEALSKLGDIDPSTRRSVFETCIRKQMQERLSDRPAIEMTWVEPHGKPVLLVHVPANQPGAATRYERDAYVRRGPNTGRADPDECAQLLRPAGGVLGGLAGRRRGFS